MRMGSQTLGSFHSLLARMTEDTAQCRGRVGDQRMGTTMLEIQQW